MSCINWTELIHFDINNALHVTSLECIPRYLFRECRQLHRLIKYHELFLRLQFALAIIDFVIPLVLSDETIIFFSLSHSHGRMLNAVSSSTESSWLIRLSF